MSPNYPRDKHFRETVQRAIRYDGEHGTQLGPLTAVISACATILFDANPTEEAEMVSRVLDARHPKRRR